MPFQVLRAAALELVASSVVALSPQQLRADDDAGRLMDQAPMCTHGPAGHPHPRDVPRGGP